MPEIKQYTRQNLPTQLNTSRRASGLDFGADQTGLLAQAAAGKEMSAAIGELGVAVKEIQERKDASEYLASATQFQIQMMKREKELSEAEFEEGTDFASVYAQDFDDAASGFLETVPRSQQAQAMQDLSRMKLGFVEIGMRDQVTRAGLRQKLLFDNMLEGQTAIVQQNPGALEGSIATVNKAIDTFKLSPEAKAVLRDEMSDALRATQKAAFQRIKNNRMESDPFAFLAEKGHSKEDYDKARDLALKEEKRIEDDQFIDSIMGDKGFFDAVMGTDPEAPPITLADVEAKARMEGETPVIKWARDRITKRTQDIPKPPDLEVAKVKGELFQELLSIENEFGVGTGFRLTKDAMKRFKDYQAKVYGYIGTRHLTDTEAVKYLEDYSLDIMDAISANRTGSGKFFDTIKPGVQNPYGKGVKLIDAKLDASGISAANWLVRQQVFNIYEKHLGKYESTGNHEKDMVIINKAFGDAVREFNAQDRPETLMMKNPPDVIVEKPKVDPRARLEELRAKKAAGTLDSGE